MCVGIGIVPMGKGGGAFLPPPPPSLPHTGLWYNWYSDI
jgi:hypothetical protein